ncbi:phosphatase PAP2 family protein [Tsukamurella sp. 8F]|uniref:phosphatase PAP2 family protein n=1 Tax=unclassified Tsukamurella TaxID=2633480 RepID=UPI0023B90393|nr:MULTISPECIES: phosphatase PAP2 family protein [unclassified Tsukamurella]MDF0529825.1 phosphatase PAP2 family protein [Tsukamurella sp. 8J]MDF0587017.1 phosphatase PAP2 family protein [Tsukamurella sp. 8F]
MSTGQWPNPFDHAVLDGAIALRTPALTAVMRAVTFIGQEAPLALFLVMTIVWLLFRRAFVDVVFCTVTPILGWLVMASLKTVGGRIRPTIPPRMVEIASPSFPSGHALNSMVALGVVAFCVAHARNASWPLWPWAAGTVLIGLSRVYLAAHWATDVLAGWLIGGIVLAAALAARGALARTRAVPAARPGRRGPPPAAAG